MADDQERSAAVSVLIAMAWEWGGWLGLSIAVWMAVTCPAIALDFWCGVASVLDAGKGFTGRARGALATCSVSCD
ncbi:hypothetical protein, partial [Xanthomonas perforans]|uniref:hypothetical protein n=1 Tax=Xanthomonas perforans TaxID=442694 RepID=UPI001F466E99